MARTLVPYEYSPGKFIAVPDDTPGLRLPDVARPKTPDARVAGPGDGWESLGGYDDSPQSIRDKIVPPTARAHTAPSAGSLVPPELGGRKPTHGGMPSADEYARADAEDTKKKAEEKSKPKGKDTDIDPTTLDKDDEAPQGESGDPMDRLISDYIAKKMQGGGGGGGSGGGGGVSSQVVKEERTPGKKYLPETLEHYGLAERQDLGEEVDPTADQPTWGNADPVMRKRVSALNQGKAAAGETAVKRGQQQIEAERVAHNQRLAQLADESRVLDEDLSLRASRRDKLQELIRVSDTRAEEARNLKPKTHEQVWNSKGGVARIGAVIAMALGGYAVGTGRARSNVPWEMINKTVDDEVQDSVDAYNRADGKASKAAAAYERALTIYGDPEVAMLDLKKQKLANVNAQLAQQATLKGLDQATQQRLSELRNTAETAYVEAAQAMADKLMGSIDKQEVTTTLKPGGGGGGGGAVNVPKLIKEAADMRKDAAYLRGETDVKPSDMKDVNQSDASLKSVDNMLKQYGAEDDIPGLADPNVFSRAARGVADWAGGTGSGSKLLDSPEERRNRQNTQNLVAGIIQSISGAGVSNEERANLNEMIRGARTKADLSNIVNIIRTKNAEFRRLATGGRQTAPTVTATSERPLK
jgi:colicin import membrane protein